MPPSRSSISTALLSICAQSTRKLSFPTFRCLTFTPLHRMSRVHNGLRQQMFPTPSGVWNSTPVSVNFSVSLQTAARGHQLVFFKVQLLLLAPFTVQCCTFLALSLTMACFYSLMTFCCTHLDPTPSWNCGPTFSAGCLLLVSNCLLQKLSSRLVRLNSWVAHFLRTV